MKFPPTIQRVTAIGMPFALACLLAACSSKPPGCADTETLQLTREILMDNVKSHLREDMQKDDPDGLVAGYLSALKVEMTNIVSNGYDADAKKQSCKGTLKVVTVNGDQFERDTVYSTQRTEDKKSKFLLEIKAFDPFISAVDGSLLQYYVDNRFAGIWSGNYACGGIGDAKDGPQGPFAMPVSMTIKKNVGVLERTTKGGGFEKLMGRIGRTMSLEGEGKNSPDDTWHTLFNGGIEGRDFSGQGEIRLADGTVLRQCTLKLKQQREQKAGS